MSGAVSAVGEADGPAAVRDVRLAVIAVAGWVTAAILVGIPDVSVTVAAVAWTGAGVVLLTVGRRRSGGGGRARALGPGAAGLWSVGVLALLSVGLVAAATAGAWERRSPEEFRGALGDGISASVELVLDRDVGPGDRSFTGTIRALSVASPGAAGAGGLVPAGAGLPVRVVPGQFDGEGRHLAAGSVVRTTGELLPEPPGSGTAVVLFGRGGMSVLARPDGLLAATDRARTAFADITATLPMPGGGLLGGLAIGDRSGLDDATAAAMETTALTHLTAVSGSNCAVLVALVMVLGRALLAPRAVRAALAIALLVGFAVLVRPDPSIVRATVMAVVVLVVHLSGRPVRGVPLLALATIGMLVVDPWSSRSFAFTLSVLATAGIVVLAPPLTVLLARRVPTWLAVVSAVPVAAQVCCWPVTVLLAPELPLLAVPVNALAEPLAPIATVFGLAACLLSPLWASAADVVAWIAWVPASAIALLARAAAGMPFAAVPWSPGLIGVIAAACVGGAVAVAVLGRGTSRRVGVVAVPVVLVVGVAIVAVPDAVLRGSVPTDWSIAMCDVGQGDAVLVRDAGRVALVDTGDEPDRLRDCLGLLRVDRIDLLVATHFDTDHVGAVDAIASVVDTALVGPLGRPEDARVIRSLETAGATVRRGMLGTSGTLGTLPWRIVWPPGSTAVGGNDASLVVRLEPDASCRSCLSALLLGDLGESSQRRFGRSDPVAVERVDVVKVAHHGSADQDTHLYRDLGAPVGLIGVGSGNGYGHPTDVALSMLREAGTTALRTDLDGTIVLGRGTDGLRVWTERARDPQHAVAGASTSAVARTLVTARNGPPRGTTDPPQEGTHARQEARPRRSEDPPGALVRDPSGPGRARDGTGDVPRRAGHRHAAGPARRRGPSARGP